MRSALALVIVLLAIGCSRGVVNDRPSPSRGVVVVGKGNGKGSGKSASKKGPRSLKIPPGHYPPPGQCRLWYPGRPPGQQPPPVQCRSLVGRARGTGAFILYNGSPWDANYDWLSHERERPGSVPEVILEILVRARTR